MLLRPPAGQWGVTSPSRWARGWGLRLTPTGRGAAYFAQVEVPGCNEGIPHPPKGLGQGQAAGLGEVPSLDDVCRSDLDLRVRYDAGIDERPSGSVDGEPAEGRRRANVSVLVMVDLSVNERGMRRDEAIPVWLRGALACQSTREHLAALAVCMGP